MVNWFCSFRTWKGKHEVLRNKTVRKAKAKPSLHVRGHTGVPGTLEWTFLVLRFSPFQGHKQVFSPASKQLATKGRASSRMECGCWEEQSLLL